MANDDNNVVFSFQLSEYTAQNTYGTSWAAQGQRYYPPTSVPLPAGYGTIFHAYYSTYGHNYATTTLSNTQEEDEEALCQASKSQALSYQLPGHSAQTAHGMSPWAGQGQRYNQSYGAMPIHSSNYPNATGSCSSMSFGG